MNMSSEKEPGCCGRFPFGFNGVCLGCSWMTNDVVLGDGQDNGEQEKMRAGSFAAFYYFTPPGPDGRSLLDLCVLLISEAVTIYLVLEGCPKCATVLREVSLPFFGGESVPQKGQGGAVFWLDNSMQAIKRFERLTPTQDDLTKMRYARFLRELSKPMSAASAAAGRVAEHDYELQARLAGVAQARAVESVPGPGYVVNGKFWIAADFTRIVKLGGDCESWAVPTFTRMIVKVLVENKQPGGLTSGEIYDRARAAYVHKHPECLAERPGMSTIPKKASLVQFFRPAQCGVKRKHPLYDEIEICGRKQATYLLSSEWVESVAAGGQADT